MNEHIVRFQPHHGCIHILFVVKGERGATDLELITDWTPTGSKGKVGYPSDWGVNTHSPVSRNGESSYIDNCEWLNGVPCYTGGSFLLGTEIKKRFLAEGDAAVWEELEGLYERIFG